MKKVFTRTTQLGRQQTGVALFISLVLLLVLTIIGVSAVQTTSLEVRMARNEHDTLLAFQSAEAALSQAERSIAALTTFGDFGSSGEYLTQDFGDAPRYLDPAIWTGNGSIVATQVDGVATAARYIIEHVASVEVDLEDNIQAGNDLNNLSEQPDIQLFRITARGTGGSDNARVLLQSTFSRPLE